MDHSNELESCGLFSDAVVPRLLVARSEPTAIRIMSSRYRDLWQAKDGYDRTGVNLLAFDGTNFAPAGLSDDSGMYLYILLISRFFHLSLAHSISLFFLGVLVLSLVTALSGLLFVLRSWSSRVVGIGALSALAFLAYRLGDVYLFEFAVPVALIPWVVKQLRQPTQDWRAYMLLAAVGVCIGWGTTVRLAAGVPVLVLVLIVIATQLKVPTRRKIILTSLVLAGSLSPLMVVHHVESKRNSFLLSRTAIQPQDLNRHTVWHFAYIGLGFISNPYVPGGVCDEMGKAKVREIAPEAPYLSQRYDEILRRHVIQLVVEHPALVFFTIAAKLGIVVMIAMVFAGIGFVASLFRPVDQSMWVVFWPALVVSGLPILLVAPSPQYLMSLMTLAALFGVFRFDGVLQPALSPSSRIADLPCSKRMAWWSSARSGISA